MQGLGRLTAGLCAAALLAGLPASPALAQGSPGIRTPQVLQPFDPAAPACTVPPGLERTLRFSKDNDRDFIEGVGQGLQAAAADRGLDYAEALAANDAARQATDVDGFVRDKAGAVVTAPVDAYSLGPHLQQVIWSGGYVGAVVPPPATTILNAPQYLTGKTLADEAARHVQEELGGRANVVLLTHDSLQFLAPRFTAMRDAFKDMEGVRIVADISPNPVSEEGGYTTMKLILAANSQIDVVLGADTVVLGALRALREAGKDRPDMFVGGIDGEPEAVAEIRKGGPYKASVALSSPVFGYALGWYAADWLEGKSVPQAMDILPFALTSENIAQYEADQADPGAVWADPAKREAYLRMYGNICYDTREQYLNFPWSSESR
ncbi:MAG TPA: sugar ABC transporter substrate-binding protein [Devosia sp.]|jgi:ribose transport system substrate-binding protein|nr:sugar ABC transporter substrate-binding protein [Devosia sp.]